MAWLACAWVEGGEKQTVTNCHYLFHRNIQIDEGYTVARGGCFLGSYDAVEEDVVAFEDCAEFFICGAGEAVFDEDLVAGILFVFLLALLLEGGMAVDVCGVGIIVITVEGEGVAVVREAKEVDSVVKVEVNGSVLLGCVGGCNINGVEEATTVVA